MKTMITALLLAGLATSASALPAAPVKPVPSGLIAGRWYEIARSANPIEGADCQGVFNDFSGRAGGDILMVQTCFSGSPAGRKRTATGHAHILPGSDSAKMQISYFGGLISHEYWIVDYDAEAGWAIMATPKAKYVWLLARSPRLDDAARAQALRRMTELGYNLARLAFTPQRGR